MTTKAPKFAPVTGEAALAMRQKDGTNQSVFWSRVGIGQSAGSRYESGRNIPASIRALIILVFGTEHHARQQLEALRDPAPDKLSKPRAPIAAAPSSAPEAAARR